MQMSSINYTVFICKSNRTETTQRKGNRKIIYRMATTEKKITFSFTATVCYCVGSDITFGNWNQKKNARVT